MHIKLFEEVKEKGKYWTISMNHMEISLKKIGVPIDYQKQIIEKVESLIDYLTPEENYKTLIIVHDPEYIFSHGSGIEWTWFYPYNQQKRELDELGFEYMGRIKISQMDRDIKKYNL